MKFIYEQRRAFYSPGTRDQLAQSLQYDNAQVLPPSDEQGKAFPAKHPLPESLSNASAVTHCEANETAPETLDKQNSNNQASSTKEEARGKKRPAPSKEDLQSKKQRNRDAQKIFR